MKVNAVIDASALDAFIRASPERARGVMRRAAPQVGQLGRTLMIRYLKKRLKRPKGILTGSIRVEHDGRLIVIGPHAQSEKGFPYPVVVDTGRRGFTPIPPKKLLRFMVGNVVVYTRKVGPFPGYHYVQHTADELPRPAGVLLQELVAAEIAKGGS